jgi:transposase-like protein
MQCPRCNNSDYVKNGLVNGRQRYKCKQCNYNYTVELKSYAKPKKLKRFALEMYLEGIGFRSIARLLKVSNVSVLKWIRDFGEKIVNYKSEYNAKIVEIDELHTYINRKKTIAGYGLLLIDMGKDSSTAYLVVEEPKLVKSS